MEVDRMKHDGEFDAGASAGRVLLHIWSALEDGVKSGSPFNLLQLASMDEANKPAVRTIVLRQFRRTPGELFFVTESASRKVAQILLNNEVSLVGYDASTWSQIRLSGQAYVVSDEQERLLQWTKLSDRTRRSFFPCVESPEADDKIPEESGAPTRRGSIPPTAFTLVKVTLCAAEFLDISKEEHLQYNFARSENVWTGGRTRPIA